MKQFEKWLEIEDKLSEGCISRDKHYRWRERDRWAKDAWRAALEWIENELDKAGDGFEPDLGLRSLLKKELNGKT